MLFSKIDKNRNITQGKPVILILKCTVCNKTKYKTNPIYLWDIKRNWQELVAQKELLNSQKCNICCDQELEYYIGRELARDIIFKER